MVLTYVLVLVRLKVTVGRNMVRVCTIPGPGTLKLILCTQYIHTRTSTVVLEVGHTLFDRGLVLEDDSNLRVFGSSSLRVLEMIIFEYSKTTPTYHKVRVES